MKAVMISIRPQWCKLIASGEKTLEVRKTRPKLEPPFKVYIYCTADMVKHIIFDEYGNRQIELVPQKIVGEFVCDTFVTDMTSGHDSLFNAAACMSEAEAAAYCTNKILYGWHISELKFYDEPKPLNMFYKMCAGLDNTGMCWECEKAVGEECDCAANGRLYLTRPPQSWCYVEEVQ